MLDSAKDRFMPAWWMDPYGDPSHRRHNSFARGSGNVSEPNKETVNRRSDVDATLDGARTKLQWISQEDQRKARNSVSSGRPSSIQSGSEDGRSASFGVRDCSGRGIPNLAAELPTRRVSTTRLNPSLDFDEMEVPSSGPPSRSTSFKEGISSTSAVVKSDQYMGLRQEHQRISKYLTDSTSLPLSEDEYIAGQLGEGLNRRRKKDSSESVMMRLNNLTDMMTNRQIDHGSESFRHCSLQTGEQTSPSNSCEFGSKGAALRILYKASPADQFSQEKMPSPDSHPRQPVARTQSQKYQQVRRLLLPDKVLGGGSRDKLNFFRRSKTLQAGSKIHPVFDISEESEAQIPGSKPALQSGFDDSRSSYDTLQGQSAFQPKIGKLQKFLVKDFSDHKSSSGLDTSRGQASFDSHFSSSTDTQSKEQSKFQSQIEKLQKFLFNTSSNHKNCRRSSFAGPERGGNPSSPSFDSFNPVFLGDSQFSEKRITVSQQERSRPVQRISLPSDHPDSDEGLYVQTTKKGNQSGRTFTSSKTQHSVREASPQRWFSQEFKVDNQRGRTVPTSTSGLQAGSMNPPRASKPQSPFRGTSPQRWFANQIEKVGSLARSSSTGKGSGLQEVERKPRTASPWRSRPEDSYDGFVPRSRQEREEQKPKKTSPWRTRPAEILKGVLPERRGRSSKWHDDPENRTPLGF